MRVITLAGSPRFPSRSSALLEYAREKLSALDIEVCHWHLQNFAPEDLLYARFDSPALLALIEQLQQADGGTLFLDELGTLSMAAQERLLRAVEYGEVTRIGANQPVQVDVRLVGATNEDRPRTRRGLVGTSPWRPRSSHKFPA